MFGEGLTANVAVKADANASDAAASAHATAATAASAAEAVAAVAATTASAAAATASAATPAPTPELTATQKWWAAFMGDRAFARARAAGKNATEAG